MKKKQKETLFSEVQDEYFLRTVKNNRIPDSSKTEASNYFFIFSSSKDKKYFKYYFELRNEFIVIKKKPEGKDIAFMNVKNAFLRVKQNTMINKKNHFSLKFIKKNIYEEIFHEDKEVVNEWFEYLKK